MQLAERYEEFEQLTFDMPSTGVLRIAISSIHKMNALDGALHRELSAIWPIVNADPSVSCVLLTSNGDHFSAGGYLPHAQEMQRSRAERLKGMEETRSTVLGMAACSKPIISAVRGAAVGAGLACALMADICIVSKTAKLCDGHTKIGLAAGDHAAGIWPLLCGMAKAKLYLLTARTLTGEEAERIGLVALAVDEAELEKEALELAASLASGAQDAIRWTKRTLNLWLRHFEPIFEASLSYEFLGFSSPEAMEGVQAFLDKREPRFPRP